MEFKLPENTLFAILLRSPWWVSGLAAMGVFAVTRLFLHEVYAIFAALPFIVIGLVAFRRQFRVPSGARLEKALAELKGMTWETFASALETGYKRQGYSVKRVEGAADFELEREGRISFVAAKRWKASSTGVEPLKALAAAGEARGAAECVYVLAGELTRNAQKFAEQSRIRPLRGADLVKLTAL